MNRDAEYVKSTIALDSPKRPRGGRMDFGFQTGKRGQKAGTLTIRQWKARNRSKHNGGGSAVNKGVGYWIVMRDGVPYGCAYGRNMGLIVMPTPLGKRP